MFTAAALGLSFAAGSVAFHALAPALTGFAAGPVTHVDAWVLAVIVCGALRSAVNKALVMTAVKGADPGASVRAGLFAREAMFGDAAELSVGILIAYAATAGPLLACRASRCCSAPSATPSWSAKPGSMPGPAC